MKLILLRKATTNAPVEVNPDQIQTMNSTGEGETTWIQVGNASLKVLGTLDEIKIKIANAIELS